LVRRTGAITEPGSVRHAGRASLRLGAGHPCPATVSPTPVRHSRPSPAAQAIGARRCRGKTCPQTPSALPGSAADTSAPPGQATNTSALPGSVTDTGCCRDSSPRQRVRTRLGRPRTSNAAASGLVRTRMRLHSVAMPAWTVTCGNLKGVRARTGSTASVSGQVLGKAARDGRCRAAGMLFRRLAGEPARDRTPCDDAYKQTRPHATAPRKLVPTRSVGR
jgi:hypothetical protein